uniref:Hematopoietic prostaglandin D synthase n=1 Tax=Parasteatoda tepidariorum TaxID=114398 RepID=A0A2L2YRT1_PARTP
MPHYKLLDYSYPTSGELARLIFQYNDIQYEAEKVETTDRIYEAEEASPFGYLPVL